MEPKSTVWTREPHTEGKHLVLGNYLNAWLPIMGVSNARIVFIDGFAGPGVYEGGERGSPLVALDALMDHKAKGSIRGEVRFLFIELDGERARHLESLVAELKPKMPPNCFVDVSQGVFDDEMGDLLDRLNKEGQQLAPSLVMIDPFGVKGIPMKLISRILQNPKCEVYISFMYESINRFKRNTGV